MSWWIGIKSKTPVIQREAELEAQNVRIEYLESVIVDLIGEPVSTTETKSKTQTSAPTEQDGERHTGNQANEKDEDVQEKLKHPAQGIDYRSDSQR